MISLARPEAIVVAQLALEAFRGFADQDIITMVAIAGGESGFNPNIAGDSPAILRELGLTAEANEILNGGRTCPPFSENGFASWGLWQINLNVHTDMVARLSGLASTDPCALATWLKNPVNNARAARAVFDERATFAPPGFTAWTVYNRQRYLNFLPEAREAVAAAQTQVPTQPSPVPSPVPTPGIGTTTTNFLIIAAAAAVGLGLVLLLLPRRQEG